MITCSSELTLLSSPWAHTFYDLIEQAREEVILASPFLSEQPLRKVAQIILKKSGAGAFRVNIVTNLATESLLSGSLDIHALLEFVAAIPRVTVTYLPSLHAKIYIADAQAAVITSANLTNNGLAGNHEYGVLLRDSTLVNQVRSDVIAYAALGNAVSVDTLAILAQAARDLQVLRRKADAAINAQLKAAFEQQTENARIELLKARAKGKTTHGIFCDTILYLLRQKGPLTTVELHPLIQQIHPDLCDDTIDRVIDGVHFGKKWKHYVRNAQQALKRSDQIGFDGRSWFLPV